MAASHKINWSASIGPTNSSYNDDYGSVSKATPLHSTFSDPLAKLRTPHSYGRHSYYSATRAQRSPQGAENDDDSDGPTQQAMAQHVTRMDRYQVRERECRSTLASLEARIHQLEQRRWEMEKSQQQQQQREQQRQVHIDAVYQDRQQTYAQEAAARDEANEALVAEWHQKRASLKASLRVLEEKMRVVENQQEWAERKLEEQRAVVARTEALADKARKAAADACQEADIAAQPVRVAADALRQEVHQLEEEASARLAVLQHATAEASMARERAQTQFESAQCDLAELRAMYADESRAHAGLAAQKAETEAAVQAQQAALQRATARLDAVCAECTAREQRTVAHCAELEDEAAQLTERVRALAVAHDERVRAVDALRDEEARLQTELARLEARAVRTTACDQDEAELAQREATAIARQADVQEKEAALEAQEQRLCASLDKLDEQARYAATLAAATQADLVRGIGPATGAAASEIVALTERVSRHVADLLAVCEDSLKGKVDLFLDASDEVKKDDRNCVGSSVLRV